MARNSVKITEIDNTVLQLGNDNVSYFIYILLIRYSVNSFS